ncbi:MAG: SHOCT-like domain-containing protein, partial [Bacillota bacterium]
KFLRVKVYDTRTGKSQVNINMPLRLLDFAVKFIPKNTGATKDIDVAGLIEAAKSGAVGKIVDVTDEEKNQHVEVCIE